MQKVYLLFVAVFIAVGLLPAQPGNDHCSDAIPMPYSETEAMLVAVDGDTRDATPDLSAGSIAVCSGTWWYDDVWFSLTMPDVIPANGIVVRAYFGSNDDDVSSVGMAFYASCDSEATAYTCYSSDNPKDDSLSVRADCLVPNATYLVRVWSGGSPNSHSGTFRIGAFANPSSPVPANVLWEETFGDGLAGWTTTGFCGVPDSSANAVWRYLPGGLIDMGAFAVDGYHILSSTVCDGAVGVDSDFDDNGGNTGNQGSGPCPATGQYRLISPAIPHGDWNVDGLSLTWVQAIRQYLSAYFVGHRIYENGAWGDWRFREVNKEYPNNDPADHVADFRNVFLSGAENGDSIQIQFIYNANYYFWAIDDVRLLEAPCVDLAASADFYAIGPAIRIPVSQTFPWWPLNDVYNNGGCDQTQVNVNCTIRNSEGQVVYDENLDFGTIPAGMLAENVHFENPVDLPAAQPDDYTGQYTVTSDMSGDSTDADFSDNVNAFAFSTTEGTYALETGATRLVAVSDAIYDQGAPFSYAFGNHFYFPRGDQYAVTSVTWGAGNPAEIAGLANTEVRLTLYAWEDINGNEIAEAGEREPVAAAQIVFDGTEPQNLIMDTELENLNNPGMPVRLRDHTRYLMMVEYLAGTQTFFFLMASEEYDYGANVLSSALAGMPMYAAVLGFSPDGDISNIDYEVTELDLDDNRIYFGWDLIPLVRLNIEMITDVEDDLLPADDGITLYPNPARDFVTLQVSFEDEVDHMQVIVFDALGKSRLIREYAHVRTSAIELNIQDLVPGAYLLHVNTGRGSRVLPFVVQR